ncbi:MAG: asparaginase [Gammaproteobacteria bacterium]|nr:asparaginase [Gammaproteobacteria bacterium]
MPKKILIIYTGGTIGMRQSANGLVPAADLAAEIMQLIELGPAFQKKPPQLHTLSYDPLIDSSDMTPAIWLKIAHDIEQRYDSYDGFVVLHGTDTLAYTSSALSYFIRRHGKPVVVTGAQLPFGFPRSDARSNLISAIEVAATMPESLAQVCVVFGSKIMRGNRVTKISANAYDAFDSPRFPLLGTIGIDIHFSGSRRLSYQSTDATQLLLPPDNNAVALLRLYPGISAALLRSVCSVKGLRALVLEAYGSGNGPSRDPLFLSEIRAAVDRGIVIVVVSQPLDGVVTFERYAAGSGLAGAGAISGRDMTAEAAISKLYFLLASGEEHHHAELGRALMHPLAGEMAVTEASRKLH